MHRELAVPVQMTFRVKALIHHTGKEYQISLIETRHDGFASLLSEIKCVPFIQTQTLIYLLNDKQKN